MKKILTDRLTKAKKFMQYVQWTHERLRENTHRPRLASKRAKWFGIGYVSNYSHPLTYRKTANEAKFICIQLQEKFIQKKLEQSDFLVFQCTEHGEKDPERWTMPHARTHQTKERKKKTRTSSDYNKTGNLYSLFCGQKWIVCHWFCYAYALWLWHIDTHTRAHMLFTIIFVNEYVLLTLMLVCASHNLSCQLSPILTLMVHVVYMDIFKMIFVGSFSPFSLARSLACAQNQVLIIIIIIIMLTVHINLWSVGNQ